MRREQFRAMLPSHITAEHFVRVVMTAVSMDPDLLSADRRSFYNACMRAANDGLLPDKREGALVVFKDQHTGARLVTWMPMVFGLIKLMRQSPDVSSVGARIVYQREIDEQSPSNPARKRFEFVITDGDEKLYHEPILWGDRGPKVLVYAYARFKDGFVQYQLLHKDDVLKRRKVARTDKVWSQWEDEMWCKSAIRAIASKMPLSADIRIDANEPGSEPTEFDKMKNSAVAALAAPVEDGTAMEIVQEPEPPPAPEPSPEPDKKTITAEEYVRNVIEGLADPSFTAAADLEEYGQRVRMGVTSMIPPGAARSRLLRQFNDAFTERMNALQPEQRS
jgi:recombination protein RecT